jgi:hypothetical protein
VQRQFDGFWFPPSVRDAILTPAKAFESLHFKGGMPVPESDDDSVTVRWPRLSLDDWRQALSILRQNQQNAQEENWHERLPQAMHQMQAAWTDRLNVLRHGVLEALETCTGHSVGMLNVALSLLELISIDDLKQAASCRFTQAVKHQFVDYNGLPGSVRFFGEDWRSSLTAQGLTHLRGYRERPWQLSRRPTNVIVGYAAGNVPGTGLLLILLGLATALGTGDPPPVILIKNSRNEPLFTPLVLATLALIDPALASTTLVTIWDYTDTALQEYLLSQADLVVAAAGDETIQDLDRVVRRVSTASHPVRFHGHGHKVSFSTVGRECLQISLTAAGESIPLVELVALLASLDVALWNQQGCLSSRVHFVEQANDSRYHSPEVYGRAVVRSLRALNASMPKGITRKRQIHNLFDKYQAAAAGGLAQVLSEYDDDFLVVLEQQRLAPDQFKELVNDCQGRTVAIIPVDDVMEVPQSYLRHVHREHLQSMSVALGEPDRPGMDPRLLRYAEALGAVGITSIRTVGRGAFPQLAYSWDGLLPLDLTAERPKGHFTALEFDQPWAQIHQTHRLIRQAMNSQT